MEFGPRSLGNRSILGDPRLVSLQSSINRNVIFRESFRPFAPAVLEGRSSDYFDLQGDSPYMLKVANVAESQLRARLGSFNEIFDIKLYVIKNLSVEERMTVFNITKERGARAGLIQPDEKTFKYLENKPMSPKKDKWNKALDYWSKLKSDYGSKFDKEVIINGNDVIPQVTWGTSPEDVVPVDGSVPDPNKEKNKDRQASMKRSLEYLSLIHI